MNCCNITHLHTLVQAQVTMLSRQTDREVSKGCTQSSPQQILLIDCCASFGSSCDNWVRWTMQVVQMDLATWTLNKQMPQTRAQSWIIFMSVIIMPFIVMVQRKMHGSLFGWYSLVWKTFKIFDWLIKVCFFFCFFSENCPCN